ncbi:MAG TPA: hypothetical protein VEM57_08760 [Candidatus Binatus sp.]|nr:hypothetical protein [Candidatus Binatus sp.]
MHAIKTKRVFVSGQLVEFWESGDMAFGWTSDDLQGYVDRSQWTLLFNALVLTAPRPREEAAQ